MGESSLAEELLDSGDKRQEVGGGMAEALESIAEAGRPCGLRH